MGWPGTWPGQNRLREGTDATDADVRSLLVRLTWCSVLPHSRADIALIGLAVMGQNLILNMNDHGFVVSEGKRCSERLTHSLEWKLSFLWVGVFYFLSGVCCFLLWVITWAALCPIARENQQCLPIPSSH